MTIKKLGFFYFSFLALLILEISTQAPANGFQLDTTDTNLDTIDNPPDDLGDFASIGEIDGNTGLGNILDVLIFSGTGTDTATLEALLNKISAPSGDHSTITSADLLGFGLGINENGNNPAILFQDVSMSFEYPTTAGDSGSPTETITFNLAVDDDTQDPDTDTALDIDIITAGGNNDSEIQLITEFPFDLFTQYDYTDSSSPGISSSYNFTISATAQNADGGNERFFISSGITSFALEQNVPFEFSPTLGLLIVGGAASFMYRHRKINVNKS